MGQVVTVFLLTKRKSACRLKPTQRTAELKDGEISKDLTVSFKLLDIVIS